MTTSWAGRLRLTLGIILVVLIVAVLTIRLNDSRGSAVSTSASIETQNYTVGAAYAGTIVEQLHEVGDDVADGEPLFTINSPALARDIASGLVDPETVAEEISEDGTLTVNASGDGRIAELMATRGSFVQSGTPLATVERKASLYVSADLTLTPTEFARLAEGAAVKIVLPNQLTLAGTVDDIKVRTSEGQAQVVVTVLSDELVDGAGGGIVGAGVPVTTDIGLSNDGVVTTVANFVSGAFSNGTS